MVVRHKLASRPPLHGRQRGSMNRGVSPPTTRHSSSASPGSSEWEIRPLRFAIHPQPKHKN